MLAVSELLIVQKIGLRSYAGLRHDPLSIPLRSGYKAHKFSNKNYILLVVKLKLKNMQYVKSKFYRNMI